MFESVLKNECFNPAKDPRNPHSTITTTSIGVAFLVDYKECEFFWIPEGFSGYTRLFC